MPKPPFDNLATPRAFGEMLNPPRSQRSVYRWMNEADGLPYTTLPSGARRINLETAWEYLKKRERQACPRRCGRRARPENAT